MMGRPGLNGTRAEVKQSGFNMKNSLKKIQIVSRIWETVFFIMGVNFIRIAEIIVLILSKK